MDSLPINDTIWMRAITLLLFHINGISWIHKRRKSPGGILYVSSKLCIRCRRGNMLCEANAIQFVAKHTSIPVPRIYCTFVHKGYVFTLMERLPGHCLGRGWVYRASESKTRILEQLHGMIDELRSIKLPSAFAVGNVDGGAFYDQRLPDKQFWGPYATIQDFHLDLRNDVKDVPSDADARLPGLRELIAFHEGPFPAPVFTHGDLHSFNILADGDKITGIIDWETAAWMPSYWEYTSTWHVNPCNSFWREEVGRFLTPFPHELEMEKVRRRYFNDLGMVN